MSVLPDDPDQTAVPDMSVPVLDSADESPDESPDESATTHHDIPPTASIYIAPAEEIDYWSLEYARPDDTRSAFDQFVCPICQTVLVEPYSTKCGHTFCKKCITSAYSSHEDHQAAQQTPGQFKCPVDRYPLDMPQDMSPAPFLIASLINELVVSCPFSARGCTFVDKRWLLDKHVDQDCLFVKVKCEGYREDLEGPCQELAERHLVAAMRGSQGPVDGDSQRPRCVHRLVECPSGCGAKLHGSDVELHLTTTCSNGEVVCEDCLETMPRAQLEYHATELCPEAIVLCPSHRLGCTWGGRRKNQKAKSEHIQSCPVIAMSPVLSQHEDRIERLEQENRVLRLHIERLTSLSNSSESAVETISTARRARRSSSSSSTDELTITDSDLLHIFMEGERLRRDVDQLTTASSDMYLKQGMMMMRENLRLTEEMAVLRSGFNGLRQQIHFLLSERRSWASHHYHGHVAGPPDAERRPAPEQLRQDVKL